MRILPTLAALALLGLAAPSSAAEGRIVGVPDDAARLLVRGSLHPLARRERSLGRADPATRLHGASLVFGRAPEAQRQLEALLAEQQDPASPGYHRWLTPEEFGERFGAAPADVAKVAAWLQARGLTVEGVSRSRTWISFGGTFGQLEAAFRTELHWFAQDGERRFAPATELSLPAAFSGVVLGLRNLDAFRPAPRVAARRVEPSPDFTSGISGNHFLAPEDFAVIYRVAPLYAAGFDGAGHSIAVAGQTQLDLADVQAFRAASGLPARDPSVVLVPGSGSPVVRSADLVEADLDVEWSGAVARSATIVYVFTGDSANLNVLDALQYAIDQDLAPIVSLSYGACEPDVPPTSAQHLRQIAQQASAQGQTVVASSGDSGPAGCDASSAASATRGFAAVLPASVPEVTAVGGTQFVADVASPATYWSAVNDASNGSALGYIPEGVWNESAQGSLAASGGGASIAFPKPPWQAGAGVPAGNTRFLPDVALNAASGHDGYLICSGGGCVNGYRRADNSLTVVGGTSAGAPSFAGFLAVLSQVVGGTGLGNVNPSLYALAASAPAAFHPISSGDSLVPCTAGSTDCPASGRIGFAATGSYSLATGLGSIDAQALAAAWTVPASTTTAVVSSAPAVLKGAAVTLSATVTPGAGTAPTGTVQFTADGLALGAPAALSGGTASRSTTSLAVGSHTIVAIYSGSVAHQGSTSPGITVQITDYALGLSPTGLTLAAGTSGTAAASVDGIGPFSGTVALSCAAPAGSHLGCSVAPASLALGGTVTGGVATLTVTTGPTSALALGGRPTGAGLALGGAGLLLGALAFPRRRRRSALAAAAALACSAGVAAGCTGKAHPVAVAAPGSYTVTLTATTGAPGAVVTHSRQLAVQVQ